VRLVIADTSPVNYLILIGHIELLPRLFERIVVPSSVQAELANLGGPLEVRNWIASPPTWLEYTPHRSWEMLPCKVLKVLMKERPLPLF